MNKSEQLYKDIRNSKRYRDNVKKGRRLEKATRQALDKIGVSYLDYSEEYNGNKATPDFIFDDKYLVECKNWNCEKYNINHDKAYNEIYLRRISYPNLKPLLIISKPNWIHKEKEWLLHLGWNIIELGYEVTDKNIKRAIFDIITAIRLIPEYVINYNYNTLIRVNIAKSDKRTKIKSSKRQKDYRIILILFLNLIKNTVLLEDKLNIKGDIREIRNLVSATIQISIDRNSRRDNKRISELTNNRITNLFTRCKTNLMIGKLNVGGRALHELKDRDKLNAVWLARHGELTNRDKLNVEEPAPHNDRTNREIVRGQAHDQTVREIVRGELAHHNRLSLSNLLTKLRGILNKNRDKEITNSKVRLSYSAPHNLFNLFTNSLCHISAITRIIKDSKDKRITTLKERLRGSAPNKLFSLFYNSLLSIQDKTILINKFKERYKK